MENKLSQFIQHAIAKPISGTSLISSLYGDALHHRGGEVWLGSLTKLLEPMGFTDRFVSNLRFPFTKEGWLDVKKSAVAAITAFLSADKVDFAVQKIKFTHQPDWDGKWTLLRSDKDEKV